MSLCLHDNVVSCTVTCLHRLSSAELEDVFADYQRVVKGLKTAQAERDRSQQELQALRDYLGPELPQRRRCRRCGDRLPYGSRGLCADCR
ncbi:hypothetical protein MPSYJ_28690 [Mycolicibacterium psychrotolerans]|uniref:Uncharacterized protein n=1 Tax=Mycolicibacterium psychrotolerans TaxID=216929 RepID=A0A7I7MAX2_9MYCO|nr:hypothetical protein MPSYJ_28690 [Mycolicibacterium psychrotolerans]